MLQQGHRLSEVLRRLEQDRATSGAYFTIDSLTHLVKGGRLSKTQGLVGSMLKIKPILRITREGTVEVDDKVRSTKKPCKPWLQRLKHINSILRSGA